MTEAEKDFASRLFFNRKAKGWSSYELARRMGINRSMISLWENGHGYPGYLHLIRLATVLEVSTDQLCGLTR